MYTTELREPELRHRCQQHGQSHLFAFWDQLPPQQRDQLLDDVRKIPFDELPALCAVVTAQTSSAASTADFEPPSFVERPQSLCDDPRTQRGEALLQHSKVAAFTVAGGQGTRLGFDGPKGAFAISPISNKSLFQLFAEQIAATDRRYGGRTRWYIMTSDANDAATREFFGQHQSFGLAPDQIRFFRQGSMPAFAPDGRILLDAPHRLALAPDGHGGSLLALSRSGALAEMASNGVEHISYFQVDNPLVRCLDPFFIGLHADSGSEMSSKCVAKASDDEKVGIFARRDGRLRVFEYSDLPAALMSARNPDGTRRFDAGSIAIHLLTRRFVERLTADAARFRLPWHRALKKTPCVDLATGRRVEPSQPNAIKLEAFVFDALPLAENPILLRTERREEFSPVKNAGGVDSVATARRDLSDRAARWLVAAGCTPMRRNTAPVAPDDLPEFPGLFEVSAFRAMQAEHLRGGGSLPANLGDRLYLE